jgi:hypothetical protein
MPTVLNVEKEIENILGAVEKVIQMLHLPLCSFVV